MLRNPRVWLYAAGYWLALAGLLSLAYHAWAIMGEHDLIGQRAFAVEAMKQVYSADPLGPSMWRVFRMLSASFGALLVFAGAANVLLAWLRTPLHVVRTFAFFGTLFWTLGFAFYVFVEPVSFPILTSVAAVPMHALAWLTALMAEEEAT